MVSGAAIRGLSGGSFNAIRVRVECVLAMIANQFRCGNEVGRGA